MNRSPLTPVLAVVWLSLLAGCQFINSINPFAPEENASLPPITNAPDPNAAPVDPNAAPVDPNAAPAAAPAAAPNVPPSQTPFRDAVNKAQNTAEAVQTAQSTEEWQAVVVGWQEAIALMQQVPEGDPDRAVAQEKVTEYTGYLEYAQTNAGQ